MKNILYTLIFLLSFSIVSAASAGSIVEVYNFEKCDSLTVNVTGTLQIEENEYNLLDCNNTNNNWIGLSRRISYTRHRIDMKMERRGDEL